MNVIEPKALFRLISGTMEGEEVEQYTKYYHEVDYLYQTKRTDDPVVYNVYSYSKGENVSGNLNWGLTVLKPVYSDHECNMTKGHFHEDKNCAEFYFGIAGSGLLLLMDEDGRTWAEKVFEGSLHYIEGIYAHRLVNTGDQDLKVGACWPTSAGHDYDAIAKREFGCRVYRENGSIVFEKRRDDNI